MNVLIVGDGGREHALAWRIAQSPSLGRLVAASPHPAWPAGTEVIAASGPVGIAELARSQRIDLVVVGPEAPLEAGVVDACAEFGIPCFGPTRAAAQLEASKAFAKIVMDEARVPTASALVVDTFDADSLALAHARCDRGDVVVKVDGLAAGKGVIVATTPEEAHAALTACTDGRFGASAARLVLEDRLEGPEVSLLALCDGERAVALPPAQDHKRLLDHDQGPNTGGMGAYAPYPRLDAAAVAEIVARVHTPVLAAMRARGTPFRGVLYAGLMLTARGPRVLEFNARFGDPECQPLMALWEDDVLPWLLGAAKGRLPEGAPRFRAGAACCVVVAAEGYPDAPVRGTAIVEPPPSPDVMAFIAGARRGVDGVLRATGGRVIGVTGWGPDAAAAAARAYAAVPGWRFPGSQIRSDIGAGA
jgi:phosphoribosylamine--glycine ligase